MAWFNYYGLAIMAIVLIPNIIFAAKHKDEFANAYNNKAVEVLEQIGRYGCMCFMVFNIPYTYFNFWFDSALTVYLTANGSLCLAYLICWIILGNKHGRLRALLLSIIPSVMFLFCGIMLASIPLIAFAVIFTINHILLSYKNADANNRYYREN